MLETAISLAFLAELIISYFSYSVKSKSIIVEDFIMLQFDFLEMARRQERLDDEVSRSFRTFLSQTRGGSREVALMALSRPLNGRSYAEMTTDVVAEVLCKAWPKR